MPKTRDWQFQTDKVKIDRPLSYKNSQVLLKIVGDIPGPVLLNSLLTKFQNCTLDSSQPIL